MASSAISPELASMAAFRASLPLGPGSDAIAERLCAVGRCCTVAKGTALPPNREHDRLVYLAAGAAKLTGLRRPLSDAQSSGQTRGERGAQILAFHFAGEWISVLRQAERDFHLIALCETQLVVFSTEQFLDVAQSDPTVTREILMRSLEALQRSRTRMMQMGHKSARQRVADFLFTIARRLGASGEGPYDLTLPMSRSDIADSLGLTLETVSRQFAELRAEGAIVTSGRSAVRLSSLALLCEVANQKPISTAQTQV